MYIAHEKLDGLDRSSVVAAIEPVLVVHRVECVELVWRSDKQGRVLEVTVERPDARTPGVGVTLDLCAEISRDLSAALDVADCISQRYRLEVGSPGVERALYNERDYARFAGQRVRLKLAQPLHSQSVIRGTLHGLDEQGRVQVQVDGAGLESLELNEIQSARLLFEWDRVEPRAGKTRRSSRESNTSRPQRKR